MSSKSPVLTEVDLVSEVKRALRQRGYRELAEVECAASGNQVTLTGSSTSFHLKQIAQTEALKISGVEQVINRIVVCK